MDERKKDEVRSPSDDGRDGSGLEPSYQQEEGVESVSQEHAGRDREQRRRQAPDEGKAEKTTRADHLGSSETTGQRAHRTRG